MRYHCATMAHRQRLNFVYRCIRPDYKMQQTCSCNTMSCAGSVKSTQPLLVSVESRVKRDTTVVHTFILQYDIL